MGTPWIASINKGFLRCEFSANGMGGGTLTIYYQSIRVDVPMEDMISLYNFITMLKKEDSAP